MGYQCSLVFLRNIWLLLCSLNVFEKHSYSQISEINVKNGDGLNNVNILLTVNITLWQLKLITFIGNDINRIAWIRFYSCYFIT